MIAKLPNDESVVYRLVQSTDLLHLYAYLQHLSPDSRSGFAPHPFDWDHIKDLNFDKNSTIKRFIAHPIESSTIIGYILLQPGLAAGDAERYRRRGQLIKIDSSASFAPSVADNWKGSGLAVGLSRYVETIAFDLGIRELVLWGGVQATNTRAIHFYNKQGYLAKGRFFYNGLENIDMSKTLQ